ncbi:hypothetical protein J6590_074292, partial [Homalodisca vitripennis]
NRTLFYLFSRALRACFKNRKFATWNYGAPGHGKGAPDGIGGSLKRTADRVVALGNDISDFRTFVEVLQTHTRRVRLAIVEEDDVTTLATMIPTKVPPYVGSMKVHQMNSLSCFSCCDCEKYILGIHQLPSEADSEPSSLPILDDVTMAEDDPDGTQAVIIDEATLTPGVFLLVKFSSMGKNPSTSLWYSYVCCIERIETDGKYEVQAFQSSGSNREFVIIENDVSHVSKNDILEVLPSPSITFCKLRPFWVVEPHVDDRNTVACKIHDNIEYLAAALHKAGIVDKATPKGIAENICCDSGNISCLRRQCNACKDLTIPYFINDNKEITVNGLQ